MAPDFRSYLGECNTWYGFMSEDKGQYDVGWQPLKNESLYMPPFTYEAWEFNTSDELDTIPMMGKLTLLTFWSLVALDLVSFVF